MNDKTDMYKGIGIAVVILAICLGVGTCNRLDNKVEPFIKIVMEKPL